MICSVALQVRKIRSNVPRTNTLTVLFLGDPLFAAIHDSLGQLLDPKEFVGRAPEQVHEFIAECIDPILAACSQSLEKSVTDTVNV